MIAATLVTLLCARMPAWRDPARVVQATAPAAAPGDPARDWTGMRIEWQLAPTLRRWLGVVMERDGS